MTRHRINTRVFGYLVIFVRVAFFTHDRFMPINLFLTQNGGGGEAYRLGWFVNFTDDRLSRLTIGM